MSSDDKDKPLIRLQSQGCNSIKLSKNMLTEVDTELLPPELENAGPWCLCGICRRMPTEEENVCCKKRMCVDRTKCSTLFALIEKFLVSDKS